MKGLDARNPKNVQLRIRLWMPRLRRAPGRVRGGHACEAAWHAGCLALSFQRPPRTRRNPSQCHEYTTHCIADPDPQTNRRSLLAIHAAWNATHLACSSSTAATRLSVRLLCRVFPPRVVQVTKSESVRLFRGALALGVTVSAHSNLDGVSAAHNSSSGAGLASIATCSIMGIRVWTSLSCLPSEARYCGRLLLV